MKKILLPACVALVFIASSCADEPKETKKEVIVVPEKKEQPVVVKEEEKPTSITLDKNGVKVESKKVKVDVKPDKN